MELGRGTEAAFAQSKKMIQSVQVLVHYDPRRMLFYHVMLLLMA